MTLNLRLFRTPITAIGVGMLLLAASVVGMNQVKVQQMLDRVGLR